MFTTDNQMYLTTRILLQIRYQLMDDQNWTGKNFFQADGGIRYYKVTGFQTCALPIYFPASTVNYTAATMQKSLKLIGGQGGAEIYAGGPSQPATFDIFADIING